MKTSWYIYTLEYSSSIKKKKMMPFEAATCMDRAIIMLNEVSQKIKTRYLYHMISLSYDITYM